MDKYKTAVRRFFAGIIDGVILLPLGFFDIWIIDTNNPAYLVIGWMLISYPSYWLYSVLMHGFYGQTLGKKVLKLKVLDISESPISMRQAFLRDSPIIVINTIALIIEISNVLVSNVGISDSLLKFNQILSMGAILWFILEIVTCLMNQKRRAIHDFIASTVVVNMDYVSSEITVE